MIHYEETIDTERIYDGKILKVRRDTVTVKGGRTAYREVLEHPGAAAIIPVTDDGDVVMIKQFRKPIESTIWEVPAGKLDPGETPLEAAKRELEEETGLRAENYEYLTAMYPSVGYSTEIIHIYLATGLTQGPSHPDEDEDLIMERIDLDLLKQKVTDGEFKDAKTIIAILLAWEKVRGE